MITETILNGIKALLLQVINILPTLDNLQLPDNFIVWITNIFSSVAYFLPLRGLLMIFIASISIYNFAILWKIITRLWDALPFT